MGEIKCYSNFSTFDSHLIQDDTTWWKANACLPSELQSPSLVILCGHVVLQGCSRFRFNKYTNVVEIL